MNALLSPLSPRLAALICLSLSSWSFHGGCAAPQAKPAAPPPTVAPQIASAPAAGPPKLRLPPTARPVRYAVELTVVPTEDTFHGAIDIRLSLSEPTALIWLNATDLKVGEAHVSTGAGGAVDLTARPVPGGDNFLGFALPRAVGPGEATLHIAYAGPISTKESIGLFRQKEGDSFYAYTDFEPTDARRLFPCFDEPSFKVPWQITLHVKKEHMAVSNAPMVSETEGPGGEKTVRFAQTQPLPSYLIAIGVGPFDVVQAESAGKKHTPVRIITPRGKAQEAHYAVQTAPQILAQLEDYFGIPYPYEKLDLIAVPQMGGAMENAGLVTFRQNLLLARRGEDTIAFKRHFAGLCAHELAHQWVGDLVTLAFWDDLWLNESFASFMDNKIMEIWKPEWENSITKISARSGAMSADSLVSARKIRQPIESENDIANAFDGITYGKGQAVLEMFESWTGPEVFRKGVQRYLQEHAFGNATADDFLSALSAEFHRDLSPAFSSFLDQAGLPVVSAALRCDPGATPVLQLSQRRYLPLGSEGKAQKTWQIPLCVRYAAGKDTGQECTLMTGPSAEIKLLAARTCPDWVLPNKGEAGYYRVHYQGDLLSRIVRKIRDGGLTLPERVGVLDDVAALMRTGDIPAADALALVPDLSREKDWHIVTSTMRIVLGVSRIVPDDLLPNYARFIRKVFASRGRAMGFRPQAGEDEETRLARPRLLSLLTFHGEDPKLQAEADRLARRWLHDRQALDPDLVDTALDVAARNGDRALFERYRTEAQRASDRDDRDSLLGALGAFRDPAIVKAALPTLLSDDFDVRESYRMLHSAFEDRKNQGVAYDFLKQNFDTLSARLPRDSVAHMPRLPGTAFCDDEHRADVATFFQGRSTRMTGGPRILAQVLEQIGLCSAYKRAQQQSVNGFLRKY